MRSLPHLGLFSEAVPDSVAKKPKRQDKAVADSTIATRASRKKTSAARAAARAAVDKPGTASLATADVSAPAAEKLPSVRSLRGAANGELLRNLYAMVFRRRSTPVHLSVQPSFSPPVPTSVTVGPLDLEGI